jgi:hypothetical protein
MNRADTIAMVDAAMVEMQGIFPPLRRSECERLINAVLGAARQQTPVSGKMDASQFTGGVMAKLDEYRMAVKDGNDDWASRARGEIFDAVYDRAVLTQQAAPEAPTPATIARNMMMQGFKSGHMVSEESAEDMLHQFDAAIASATHQATLAAPTYQTAIDHTNTLWQDVSKDNYDAHPDYWARGKRVVYTATASPPKPAASQQAVAGFTVTGMLGSSNNNEPVKIAATTASASSTRPAITKRWLREVAEDAGFLVTDDGEIRTSVTGTGPDLLPWLRRLLGNLQIASSQVHPDSALPSKPTPQPQALGQWISGTLPPDDRQVVVELKGGTSRRAQYTVARYYRTETGKHEGPPAWADEHGNVLEIRRWKYIN